MATFMEESWHGSLAACPTEFWFRVDRSWSYTLYWTRLSHGRALQHYTVSPDLMAQSAPHQPPRQIFGPRMAQQVYPMARPATQLRATRHLHQLVRTGCKGGDPVQCPFLPFLSAPGQRLSSASATRTHRMMGKAASYTIHQGVISRAARSSLTLLETTVAPVQYMIDVCA